MQIPVFAKAVKTRDGKKYTKYITRLNTRDGSQLSAEVKFRTQPPRPESCPCNIQFDRSSANLATRSYITQEGELREAKTLWVNEWTPGAAYIDHSLDDIAD